MSRTNGLLDTAIAQAYVELADGWRDASPNAVSLVTFSELRNEIRNSPTVRFSGKFLFPVGVLMGSILVGVGQALTGG